jgi:hypothetical protein
MTSTQTSPTPASSNPTSKRSSNSPRIALIHATPLAISPIQDAFKRLWPAPTLLNLLDDSLSTDHAKNQGVLTDEMVQRFVDLAKYVKRTGADAILFTCSAFGPAIETAAGQVGIPTLKPNQAMFEEALRLAPSYRNQLALIATFEPSLAPMCVEFAALAGNAPEASRLSPHYVPEAMALLAQGEVTEHHRLIADQVASLSTQTLILLAQFSMAAAQSEVSKRTKANVLTSPDCAVSALKSIFCD